MKISSFHSHSPNASRRAVGAIATFGLLLLPALPSSAQGHIEDVVINEVDSDTPSNDLLEFVELYDGGVGNTPLDGLVLVFFNGSNDLSYHAIDLDGAVTDPQGFFVVGNDAVANVGITFPGNTLQNGADAVALYFGNDTDFPNSSALTTTNLRDALVYGTTDADDFGLLVGLAPAGVTLTQVDEAGGGDKDIQSMARKPDGGNSFNSAAYVTQESTPGVSNVVTLELTLLPSPETISESGGTVASQVTVLLDGDAPTSDLTVALANSDPSELSIPATVVIPAGMTMGSFTATAVNDAWPDGNQAVTVTATAVGYFDGIAVITVNDDGDADPGIVINEVYAAVDSGSGDANQDGFVGDGDGSDEFVEIVNATGANLDLSGFTLSDAATVRHTFPPNTILEPSCAVVVFGAGNITEGRLALFGGAVAQKANGSNEFGLSLNNAGDLVSVRQSAAGGGLEVAGYSFGVSGMTFGGNTTSQGSFARDPDLTGNHVLGPYSPGYLRDNFTPFCLPPAQFTVVPAANPVLENAGAVMLGITVPSPPAFALTVNLSSSKPGAASVPATAVIGAGATSTEVPVTLLDNAYRNAPVDVTLTASALGFLTGSTVVTIDDDGDPAVNVFLNEFDSDQPGNEDFEFIELYDGGIGNFPLSGLVVVLFNGNGDVSYETIDLAGQTTDPNGFFVLGDAAVPNVDLVVNSLSLQNGPDGIALYRASAASFPSGTPPTDFDLVDAVVYDTGNTSADGLLAILTPTSTFVNEGPDNNSDAAARVPDGGAPRESANFIAQTPTPGASNVITGTGYDNWAADFPGIGSQVDDREFDGLVNLIEYVLGKNPTVADPSPSLVPVVNGDGNPQVSIAKGAAAGADTALVIRVEASANLQTGSWSTADTRVIADTPSSLVVEYTGTDPDVHLRLTAFYP